MHKIGDLCIKDYLTEKGGADSLQSHLFFIPLQRIHELISSTTELSRKMADFIDIFGHSTTPEPKDPTSDRVAVMLYEMYKVCMAKENLTEAAEMLYMMEKILRINNVTDEELLSLPDKVTDYFAEKNKPQPPTKFEGFFYGRPDGRLPFETEDTYNDVEIALALSRLVGKDCLINQKRKWAGAYWCLRWMCDYPVDVLEFCGRIATLRLNLQPEYECSYENIRKLCTLSFMDYDFRRMDKVRVSEMDRDAFAICRQVAQNLEAELRRIHRSE